MKTVVTGGTGFTGSHLVKRLLSRGHEVHVLDNQKGIMFDELEKLGARIHLGSVEDTEQLRKMIPGCGIVYHLAAAFRKVNLPKKEYWGTNVEAMRQLLDIAKKNNVRKFVYCSTQGVHGDVKQVPGDENSPIAPEDYYQLTKWEGERIAQEFIREGMDITILRPTGIYGPGDPGRFLMLFRQVQSGVFPFFGNGGAVYHPVYVENFVDAFELAAEKPAARGQVYIIGDEKWYTIKEVVKMTANVMGIKLRIIHFPFWALYAVSAVVELVFKPLPLEPPLFRRRADWYRQNRAFSIAKARRDLGFVPKVDLRTGLTRTYEWYRKNGYLKQPARDMAEQYARN